MNLKFNNEISSSQKLVKSAKTLSRIKEERQRTGRFIAISVGISLFLLAIYHAWIRRIPVVASLVVPALIMFIYVGWVLQTASRDKHRALDAEAAAALSLEENNQQNIVDLSLSTDSIRTTNAPEETKGNPVIPTGQNKIVRIKPMILINDKPPDDEDLIWPTEVIIQTEKKNFSFKMLPQNRRFKRRFCRTKKYAAFKRSYSIG